MNIFFSADLHEGHANILKYCTRPFKDVDEQHATLVHNFNERVKPDDWVFHVGDFCFRNSSGGKAGEGTTEKYYKWRKDFQGEWIFIQGNHDKNNSLKTPIRRMYLRHGKKDICLVHNPEHADPKTELNLVGHVHTAWKVRRLSPKSIMVNVGVDQWNFRPVTFDEINKALSEFKKRELDGTIKDAEKKELQSTQVGE
jgi:calcineurin-like phosphoesterase family protein